MADTAFRRAREFGKSTGSWWTIDLVAILSALIVPLLIIDLGLAIQLLVSRREADADVPQDVIFGPIVRGDYGTWPPFGSHERCLLFLVVLGCAMAVLESIAVWALYRTVHVWAFRTTTKIKAEIRAQAFRIGPNDLLSDRRSRPEELFTDKAEKLRRELVRWRLAVPRSGVAFVVLLFLALLISFWLTILAVVLAAAIWWVYSRRRNHFHEIAHGWHEEAEQRHQRLLESFRLAPLISGYSLTETPGERFEAGHSEYESAALKANTIEALVRPLLLLTVLFAAALFILAVGLRPDTSVAGSVALVAALICAYYPAARLYRLNAVKREAEQAAAEIFSYLDRSPSVGQIADAKPLERLQREIRFDNVILADRAGKKLLNEVSFTMAAGQRISIVASDSHTPIALAGLLVRFYDAAAGHILFDDQDVRRATLDTIRNQAIFVSQDGPLFAGSVVDNLACGNSTITSLQLTDAAKAVGSYDFIMGLPQSFSTQIGPMDNRIRGEQAFLLGLTRALLRQPSLLIVEEPPNELEEAAAAQVDSALQAVASGRTVIVLATRLATLRASDCVYVFHDGKLHAQGKHSELLQSNELYRHLNYVRFNPFRHHRMGQDA